MPSRREANLDIFDLANDQVTRSHEEHTRRLHISTIGLAPNLARDFHLNGQAYIDGLTGLTTF